MRSNPNNVVDLAEAKQVNRGVDASQGSVGEGEPASPVDPERDCLRLDDEYKSWGCHLCEMLVSAVLDVPKLSLRAPTRGYASVAEARQVAMYLCHIQFGLCYRDVGIYFGRDRTTVAHACHLIEDRRDAPDFDLMLTRMEGILEVANRQQHQYLSQRPDLMARG